MNAYIFCVQCRVEESNRNYFHFSNRVRKYKKNKKKMARLVLAAKKKESIRRVNVSIDFIKLLNDNIVE